MKKHPSHISPNTGSCHVKLELPEHWAVVCVSLVALVFWFYSFVFSFWWSHDDGHHLLFALEHHPAEYLFDPQVYRKFHDVHLAPWNILSYDINLALFDVQPEGFFFHQVVSTSLLALATFTLLGFWVSIPWAILGTSIFLISPPTITIVSQLMNIHYLEGALFTVVAIMLYLYSLTSRRIWWSVLGAVFYFLATASKEIYVPLVILLAFLPVAGIQQRARSLTPYFFIAVFYIFWRGIFIQNSFGTWVQLLEIRDVVTLPARLACIAIGNSKASLVVSVLVLATVSCALYRNPRYRVFAAVAVTCLTIPLLPLADTNQPARYHVFVSWILSCAFAVSAFLIYREGGWKRYVIVLCSVTVFLTMFIQSSRHIENQIRVNSLFATIGRFIYEQDADKTLITPSNSWQAERFRRLRALQGKGPAPELYYDVRQMDNYRDSSEPLYFYDEENLEIREVTGQWDKFTRQWNSRVKEEKLSLHLARNEYGVTWYFGPYPDHGYSVLLLSGNAAFTRVQSRGIYRAPLQPMTFILRYASPEGWITYSDPLTWNNGATEVLDWSRE